MFLLLVVLPIVTPRIGNALTTTSLENWWACEETSGVRYDSHGSDDLTDNNTVGYATGIVGTACDFNSANSEYLSTAGLVPYDDFTLTFWINPDNAASNPYLLGNTDGTDGLSFQTRVATFNPVAVLNSSVQTNIQPAHHAVNGSWSFVALQYDASESNLIYWADGDYVTSTEVNSDVTFIGDPSNDFYFGNRYSTGTYYDGQMDEISYWTRVLSEAEIDEIYNGGTGASYADLFGTSTATSTATSTEASTTISVLTSGDQLWVLIFILIYLVSFVGFYKLVRSFL
jgi:hypothetical protein